MGEIIFGRFVDAPAIVRYSSALKKLREQGAHETAAQLTADKLRVGSHCPHHGTLEDPVIGTLGTSAGVQVAFACPWCSGSEILAAWVKEGEVSGG